MHVQVVAGAETLAKGNGGTFDGSLEIGETTFLPAVDLLHGDASHGRERIGLGREQQAELERNAENPLSKGYVRDDVVDQVSRSIRHAAGIARRADPPKLARERDQKLVTTARAEGSSKAVSQLSALQVASKFLLHVPGQALIAFVLDVE
jgi:hypothetical protein